MTTELEDAMWAQDLDKLNELAPCRCCCHEHTYGQCPARRRGGCRGQGVDPDEHIAWARHYREQHGMSEAVFYGIVEQGVE